MDKETLPPAALEWVQDKDEFAEAGMFQLGANQYALLYNNAIREEFYAVVLCIHADDRRIHLCSKLQYHVGLFVHDKNTLEGTSIAIFTSIKIYCVLFISKKTQFTVDNCVAVFYSLGLLVVLQGRGLGT